jgi:hypothetical protein
MITSNGEIPNARSEGILIAPSEGTIGTRSEGAMTTRSERPIGMWSWSTPWAN